MEREALKISDVSYVHTVDMSSRTCSCKSWMLKEIPCPHAIAAILYKNWEPIDYVDDCYSKETYLRTYCHYLQPVTNMKMWSDSTNPHVEPPVVKSMPGRPRKVRNKKY
uniref:SWIM-type domain-containing protein n=1 Tax=Solanum tuberosum TaxID=4113 RepID=M1BK05_SOLTU